MLLRTLTPFCLLCACVFGATERPSKAALEDVLKAIEKGVNFFSEDYSSINVDGLFGLRLGQGQLREAVRECRERSCDPELLKNLTSLDERLGTTCDSALPYVEATDPAYYNRFIKTINKPYITPYTSTLFEEKDDVEVGTNTRYDEELGDVCFSRLMGTYLENDKPLPVCNTTFDCWDYMTTENTAGYVITHQLLYFIIIDHVGCRESVEDFIKKGKVQEIQEDLCNKIYAESKILENKGQVRTHRHDLFLEQTVLCGPLGFENFMRSDWMKMVLTWPDKKDGCFKLNLIEQIIDMQREKDAEAGLEVQRRNRFQDETVSNSRLTMRKLLREKQMRDGCLSHTSGLGFGVLCTYLRYLVRLP